MISLRDVLAGTDGRLHGPPGADTLFNRVVHDSRQVGVGNLFVAVRGERLDGHDFVREAFDRGAAGALVDEAHVASLESLGRPLVVVDETLTAVQRLAVYWRSLFNVRVIGITGSMGKSSTKEVVASVVGQSFQTVRSRGSYNNEIGLPLTLLEITPDTSVVVLEMGGAYRAGEIRELAEMARPQIGIVTNVSYSHLERMGSLEAIAETKSELPESLPLEGVAILNGDDFRVREMATRTRARVITYGLAPDVDIRATEVESRGLDGISFRLTFEGDDHFINVPLLGAHSVHTVLAAIATGQALGMGLDQMLPGFKGPNIQFRLLTVPGWGGSTLVDDTYNANPSSCLAALNLLNELPAQRRIAVFGDILELGAFEDEGHRIVGRRAAVVVDRLFTVGQKAAIIADAARDIGMPDDAVSVLPDKASVIPLLREELQRGDYVLIKGSRGVKMEEVVEAIRDRNRPA